MAAIIARHTHTIRPGQFDVADILLDPVGNPLASDCQHHKDYTSIFPPQMN